MRTLARILSPSFLLVVFCLALPDMKAQTARPSPTVRTGVIAGRVMIDGRGAAAGIMIIVAPFDYNYATERQIIGRARTDAEGRFRVSGLPAGRFRVVAFGHAFVAQDRTSEGESGQLITLGEGETVEDIDITLARGGVITGRVTDSDNRPIVEEYIRLIPVNERGEPRSVRLYDGFNPYRMRTNDLGVYRIYGLPAGRYRVSVGRAPNDGSLGRSVVFRQTFAPGVIEEREARIVTIEAGEVTEGVGIRVGRREETFSASGRIVNAETNEPMPNIRFGCGVLRGGSVHSSMIGNITGARGEFRLENLTPGTCEAFAFFSPYEDNEDYYGDPVRFEITDRDVRDLEIRIHRGAAISGTIIVEGTDDPEASARLRELWVYAAPTDRSASFSTGNNAARIAADNSFQLRGLRPGAVRLILTGARRGHSFRILRVERGGVAVDGNITMAAGERVTGVRLVVARGTGRVRGQVRITNGTLPTGALLSVMARRASDGEHQAGAQVDSRGNFILEGLLAAEYDLELNVYIIPSEGARPTRLPTVRQRVTVTDGAETRVTLDLNLSQTPNDNEQ
jgi:hypothetical protein